MALSVPRERQNTHMIFDVIYGFIPLTEWEERIISSPFFQRLRWIKQLGFAHYIFPGAEHTRFAHAIGVMHSMDQMLRSLNLAVNDDELFDPKATSEAARFHQQMRLAALLHDIGTFPFSHAIEYAYIRHGNDQRREGDQLKHLPNSHEHLGSFIIKNTPYEHGITRILEDYSFDKARISRIIKGESESLIANQLLHSDLDADRMDYLIRDAYYTGIHYGQFDRDYLLANLVTYEAGSNQLAFGVKESALHAVEDFLISRFSWYSQVIRNQESAKFDIMASHITKAFLERDLMHQFQDLLNMIHENDERFFWWNDPYFLTRCQSIHYNREIQHSQTAQLTEMLLYRRAPKTVEHSLFEHRILSTKQQQQADGGSERSKYIQEIKSLVEKMQKTLKKHGQGHEWLLFDLPHKDVAFTADYTQILRNRESDNLYQQRDPVKIVDKKGNPSLLVEHPNALMKQLAGVINFIPCVYANQAAINLLKKQKLIS